MYDTFRPLQAPIILAQAVKRMYRIENGGGPTIEKRIFHYDFDLEHRFLEEDLEKELKKKMQKCIKKI